MEKLKLSIIGCGAVTRYNHLPAIKRCDRVELTALVDNFVPRARELAERYGVSTVMQDYRDIFGSVDAAIVALPNFLHAPVTTDLLKHGIHVLVEKPMALSSSEGQEMMEAAKHSGVNLAVGLEFRFFDSSLFVKQLIENEFLGDITSFDLHQGVILRWPMTSDYLFQRELAGGGVLVDFGVHVLDLILWWLGDYRSVEYFDDAMGGVEANCELRLQLQSGVSGNVVLSRNRNLRNTCTISGKRGMLEIGIWDPDPYVHLTVSGQSISVAGQVIKNDKTRSDGTTTKKTLQDAVHRQLEDFVDGILDKREPFVPGKEAIRTVKLIEACYASRHPIQQPWLSSKPALNQALRGELS